MTLGRAFVAALIGLTFVSSTPAAAERSAGASRTAFVRLDDGSFLHKASGFVFPRQLDRLIAARERIYALDNVSVRYGDPSASGKPSVELHVYPADGTIEQEAADVSQTIVERFQATPLPDMRTLPATAADGRTRWYSVKAGGTGITGYVLVRRGGWSIKAQATSPVTAGVPGVEQLFDAIAAVRWNWMPQPAPASVIKAVAR